MIFIQALHEMLVLAPVKGATMKPKKFTFIYLFCIKRQHLHYETPTFFIMCIIFGMMPNSHFCFTFIVSNILWFEDCFFRSWLHHVALNLAKHDYVHTFGDMCVPSLCAKQHIPSTLVDPMDDTDNDLLSPSVGSLLWFNSVNHLVKTRGK